MAVTLTSGSLTLTSSWTVQNTNTGAPATIASSSWVPKLSFTNGTGAGNANNYISVIRTLAGGANESIDLTATLADLVGTSSVTILTVRVFLFWLLSTAQTGPDASTVGTAASSVTLGNGVTPAFTATAGFIGGATNTLNVYNGGFLCTGVANAGGFTVDGTHKLLKVLNNDGANVATYAIELFITM